jgi:hypothetical protein
MSSLIWSSLVLTTHRLTGQVAKNAAATNSLHTAFRPTLYLIAL